SLAPGETRPVRFALAARDLAFWRRDMTFGAEPGRFRVMVGSSSADTSSATFDLVE
ncbi:MAG TPA: fibronectin type III-like domain-contianing protein, partial [Alphaproteobacteria bacterium]|nr:fibronectin type III-like domain-contianing protein [Alphaproteobacteria bacterium]